MNNSENQKQISRVVELTEAETDRVAGGDNGQHNGGVNGQHFGLTAKETDQAAWTLNPGHNK